MKYVRPDVVNQVRYKHSDQTKGGAKRLLLFGIRICVAGLEQGGGSSESPPHGEETAIAAACAFSPALAPGLPRCTPGDPAGDGLAQAEEEEGRGHEVQREHVELDADP